MEEFYHPKTVWVPLGILLGSGTLFAVLTLQWQRCFVTFSTATFGSAIITVTVDYFIELFALVHYIYERLRVGLFVLLSAFVLMLFISCHLEACQGMSMVGRYRLPLFSCWTVYLGQPFLLVIV